MKIVQIKEKIRKIVDTVLGFAFLELMLIWGRAIGQEMVAGKTVDTVLGFAFFQLMLISE